MERRGGDSFVIRMWTESSDADVEWRWEVHHIQSGKHRYSRSLADVLAFVGEFAKVAPPEVYSRGDRP